ncbi:MAG: hypothetical protein G3M78_12705 [Candidatus Nitrohelix vancouverensis]|uniref:ABC3 transporter permease protein domain-containing protein n=1 Tax=Candidatus Nitrohelix vancouverensis TaxID=2705534 RepID=A0A7T0C449_9BACT|nr:MAG: hypothetical protein G3M78_12705 [Candidatus Nitrohelix vancouverensis]
MFRWIALGILRDKTRSLFPFLIVTVGVSLTVFMIGFMDGIMGGMVHSTAYLDTGHLRLVNQAYYDEEHLHPIDLALAGEEDTRRWLKERSPKEIEWSPRIRWGALLDIPNAKGETKSQTPITGMALELLNPESLEAQRLGLTDSLTAGRLPSQPMEMLLGYQLARSLSVKIGDKATLIGQTFDGGMAAENFKIVGFVKFGISALDRKMALIDLRDAQLTFDMDGMATDWLGFVPKQNSLGELSELKRVLAEQAVDWAKPESWASGDSPLFLSALDQRGLGEIYNKFKVVRGVIIGVFVFLMVLVLWNAGIINIIHRYGEMGLRLALGESHAGLIATLLAEALVIGVLGAAAGGVIGAGFTYYMQEVGIDMGDNMAQTGLMISDVVRARLSSEGVIFGMIPGVLAGVAGAWIASLVIYKRSEANLFRELEFG